MLNTKKILYVLPDLAYIAELLPSKKPNSFDIHNFKQINGDLISGNKLLVNNIVKLGKKLDKDDYLVVLPDQIFTNTIVNIEADSEAEVKEQIKEKILDDLKIDADSHLIETFVLTEFKGTYKVQLSAVDKSMIAPLKAGLAESKANISKVYPLSWTMKSLISLEPSISVLQLGSNLFLAKHYIGVDQPVIAELDQTDKIVETVKTLKGSEPSIQTLYLLSNDLVEQELKENLSEILPIQQIADSEDDEDKIPPYVKRAITAGMKTISIDDFEIPQFDLTKIKTEGVKFEIDEPEELEEEKKEKDLPKPSTEPTQAAEPALVQAQAKTETKVDKIKEVESKAEEVEEMEEIDGEEDEFEEGGKSEEVDLKQFAQLEASVVDVEVEPEQTDRKERKIKPKSKPEKKKEKKVIKNNDGLGSFLKMFLVGLASFAVTVAIGVGIGLGVLQLSKQDPSQVDSPIAEQSEEVTPSPEPSPSPTQAPEIAKEELSVKVVNATTKAGYAGEVSQDLEDEGYGEVVASNAQGEYEEGFYILMKEEDQNLINVLSEDTGFELEFLAEIEPEDPNENYDLVIVLAQQ